MPLMTDSDLITSLRRLADIAGSTDRAAVLAEAADRLESLAADGDRLDWLGSSPMGTSEVSLWSDRGWVLFRNYPHRLWVYRRTIRDTIDAARKVAENHDA